MCFVTFVVLSFRALTLLVKKTIHPGFDYGARCPAVSTMTATFEAPVWFRETEQKFCPRCTQPTLPWWTGWVYIWSKVMQQGKVWAMPSWCRGCVTNTSCPYRCSSAHGGLSPLPRAYFPSVIWSWLGTRKSIDNQPLKTCCILSYHHTALQHCWLKPFIWL